MLHCHAIVYLILYQLGMIIIPPKVLETSVCILLRFCVDIQVAIQETEVSEQSIASPTIEVAF